MINLQKINFIGTVAVRKPGNESESIGEARVEKLRSGALVYHINLSDKDADFLRRGFSLGELPVIEEEH